VSSLHDFEVKDAQGQPFPLAQLKGNVVLVVNVASKCGFTPQYAGLEELFRQYRDRGFTVLGFPCNQFGGQEPGTENEIVQFCTTNYDVSFPMMSKIEVNGSKANPVYEFLKSSAPGVLGTELIKWNFTKFLISREGKVLGRYAPQTYPMDIAPAIEKALA
jgi:glutathione peroxidase